MNRQQAEHILEAYINMECSGGDNNARAALREVIIDAMASYTVAAPNLSDSTSWPYANRNIVTC